ncbi:uncharacterized protein LOC142240491 [Haematobia irritans]|uniref:uncharacterized protein LOC142240491 n=1 Tax=Haematobia irritans TaxID=7368 RepID=UPI003F504598
MVENRKLFYAISVLLLSCCCQMITMFPHNADTELSSGGGGGGTTIIDGPTARTNSSGNAAIASSNGDTSNNSEFNRANVDSGSNQSNNNDDDSEFIIAVERMLQDQHNNQKEAQQQQQQHHHHPMHQSSDGSLVSGIGNLGVWEAPDSEASENVDDLIFLDKRPINQHQYVARLPTPKSPLEPRHGHLFEIHHHLSADGGDSGSSSTSDEHSDASLTHPTFASSTASDLHLPLFKNTDLEEANAAWLRHEIQLQPDNNEEVSRTTPRMMATMVTSTTMAPVTPLDLSDFLALIPLAKVKAIVAHYYRNDPEVQRAQSFMASQDFIKLKHHIITIPEMSAFLRYLNSSGLDLVRFVTALTNMTTTSVENATTETTGKGEIPLNTADGSRSALETNDIEYGLKQNEVATTAITLVDAITSFPSNIEIRTHEPSSSSSPVEVEESAFVPTTTTAAIHAAMDTETTTIKEQLNGLHGLVDSILDILPQDQILATFFDKLESNEQFSKLVDTIGSPEFSKILNNMQNCIPLRNLIFTLHNNGIYVIRIVDSLKSYFFLGGF